MNYAESVALNHPIGSGVIEAAWQNDMKQRLGQNQVCNARKLGWGYFKPESLGAFYGSLGTVLGAK